MDIGISMWRQRNGAFNCCQFSCNDKCDSFSTSELSSFLSAFFSIAIAISFVIGGVELYPGPTEITDNFNIKYQQLIIIVDSLNIY